MAKEHRHDDDRLQDHIEKVHSKYHKLVARAWDDAAFKERLIAEPDAVFKEEGVELPGGVRPRVHENTAEAWNFILPARAADFLDENLHLSAEADSCVCTCCCGYTTSFSEQLAAIRGGER
jgi:Nitrile hydratase, alpha chain